MPEVEYSLRCADCGAPFRWHNVKRQLCDECRVRRRREARLRWATENREKNREVQARYRANNRETINARVAEWAERNPERKKASVDAWKERNREKVREQAREAGLRRRQREDYRISKRRHVLKSLYGMTPEQYDELLASQGGGCAICGGVCTSGKQLAVEHCHETGEVRGLCCARCNLGLGNFLHSPERLRAAARYLEDHANRQLRLAA